MRTLELTFELKPVAKQSAKFRSSNNHIYSYQPKKINDFKKAVRLAVMVQLGADFEIFDCPVGIEVQYIYAPLKSMSNKTLQRIKNGERVYKDTRPDVNDNLPKGFIDALNGILWTDDAKICDSRGIKFFGEKDCIKLKVFEL